MDSVVWYTFRDAVAGRDPSAAEELLAGNPSLVTLRNGIGETVLHFLAVENDIAQLEYRALFLWYVQNGVDLSVKDGEGNDLVAHLLEFGKDDMARFVVTAAGLTGGPTWFLASEPRAPAMHSRAHSSAEIGLR